MNVLDAACHLVRTYPGGATALAPRMGGKSPTTLSHELKAEGFAKLGLLDAVALTHLTGNPAIVQAFAAEAGGVFVPSAHAEAAGDLAALGVAVKEFGELAAEYTADLADGAVSANELARIEREALQAIAAIQSLAAHARHMHESTAHAPSLRTKPAGAGDKPLRRAA